MSTNASAASGALCSGYVAAPNPHINLAVNTCIKEWFTADNQQRKQVTVTVKNNSGSNAFVNNLGAMVSDFGGSWSCDPPNGYLTVAPGATYTCNSYEVVDTNFDANSERGVAWLSFWDPVTGTWTMDSIFTSPYLS
ncbi:hypothetical protein ACF064_32565 [Streptomyces sp. NPDC015492]|uniref:hypothetical protein n=1 Tax=Streptomyces sp. NPDC015492 TaxID=3364958 RepID=UPI0036FEC15D